MRVSVLGSIFLHGFILLFTVLSLPLFNNNDFSDETLNKIKCYKYFGCATSLD